MTAAEILRNAENTAIAGGSFYSGSGLATARSGKGASLAARFSNFTSKKRNGIAALVLILLLGVGGVVIGSGGSHLLLAPAMEALTTEKTDTQYPSLIERSAEITNAMLKGESAVSPAWTGSKKYTNMTPRLQTRLAEQGIEVKGSGSGRTLSFKGQNITADDFITVYKDNAEFRSAFLKAKRGRVASFFDTAATKIYSKLGLNRNLLNDYKQTGDINVDTENFDETMTPRYDNNSSSIHDASVHQVQDTDADGNPLYNDDGTPMTHPETQNPTDLSGSSNSSIVEAENKARTFINEVTNKVSGLGQAAEAACMMLRIGATISAIVAANEIYQSINYFMNYMESISKMKAGLGSESAINTVLNDLTTPVTTEYSDFADTANVGAVKNITGSPVEANGMQMMLADAPANPSTTKNYSIERTMSAIAVMLGISQEQVKTCAAVQSSKALVSIIVTVSTFGVATIGQVLLNIGVSVGISGIASVVLGFLIPTIARSLFTNIFQTAIGIPAGELLARGASAANTRVGRTGSGQSPSSREAAVAYSYLSQQVIAMDAEVDRLNRSPFDITSKNTFLGSIAYSILPLTLNSSSQSAIASSTNTILRSTSSALASLTGTASAMSSSSYMANFGDCDTLDEIDAVGDIYCTPVTTTDTSTIKVAPNDPTYVDIISKQLNCDDAGNCEIKTDKELDCDRDGVCVERTPDLARYITYCAGRDSPFGIVDANILGDLEVGNVLLNVIPLIGDLLDIVNGIFSDENLNWATGKYCVNSNQNPKWGVFKYYQRYVEDQRILEQMGAYDGEGEQNPVILYQDKYEAEHPIDNSYAGYLARISGVTKETAEGVIALATYYQFIDDYDPSTRIAMDNNHSPSTTDIMLTAKHDSLQFTSSEKITPETVAVIAHHHYIVYADVRNRSYAA